MAAWKQTFPYRFQNNRRQCHNLVYIAYPQHQASARWICFSLICAGAAGNIFDCVFYGEIFNNPYPPAVAQFVPWGQGYAPIFEGMVVDMFYFPLFSFTWPSWVPVLGGSVFSFFDPVFNFADAAISVGMIALIIFYHRYLLVLNEKGMDEIENEKKK